MNDIGVVGREPIVRPSILTLAARIEAIYREMERDEGLKLANGAKFEAGPAQTGNSKDALIEEIQEQIEAMPASDLAEAMIHAMLASARVEYIRSCLDEKQAAQLVPAERLIRSVLRVLVGEAQFDLASFGGRRYVPELATLTARDG